MAGSLAIEQQLRTTMKRRRLDTKEDYKETKKQKRSVAYTETEYEFRNNLRCVFPYPFKYETNARGRWIGKTLIAMFGEEFGAQSPEYYKQAIESGGILVNGKKVTCNYKIKNADRIEHYSHRHEPPVSAEKVEVVFQDHDYVVVNKPSSIPVHESGAYRFNSLLFILAKEQGLENLHSMHRLDRLTSGLVIFAKNKESAKRFTESMTGGDVQKTYLARVMGEFPLDESATTLKPFVHGDEGTVSWIDEEGTSKVFVDVPLLTVDFKDGVNACHKDGKPSSTIFHRIAYDGITSVVVAKPLTGRTHQIRLHLQWLGFPIANDPNYGGVPNYGEVATSLASDVPHDGAVEGKVDIKPDVAKADGDEECGEGAVSASLEKKVLDAGEMPSLATLKANCRYCINAYDTDKEGHLHYNRIWLHAWKYKVVRADAETIEYEVPMPSWSVL